MDLGLGLLNTLRAHDAFNWLEDALNKYKNIQCYKVMGF